MDERNVAVIVETSNSYARGILRGIHEYARTRHGWTLYLTEHGRHEIDESFAGNWKFDGVIARIETDRMARIITAMDVPTVDVSAARLIEGIPWVETDDEAITRLALDHLRDCGLQNFAYFGDPFYNWSIWRQQNFERILGRPDIIRSRIFNLPARKEPRVRWWTQREAIRTGWRACPSRSASSPATMPAASSSSKSAATTTSRFPRISPSSASTTTSCCASWRRPACRASSPIRSGPAPTPPKFWTA